MTKQAHDDTARFIYILTNGKRRYLEFEDFESMILDLINTHPSLTHLLSAVQFHMSYVEVVTCRIFWIVNRSWSGRITAQELRGSDFLEVNYD
ncbi:unnamed protein product [Anisakis simplex]|uniref:Phosphatase 2a regulatory subunit-related (inferred by orthology to a S. mansoni protein) n=1 Tax=Anisakis simplex TaxID=6269 RepID=A0A0M3JBZ0_ANISI|nr:unnamed protein product [Anisakis simplex]